jgi:hypothetical protein
VPVKTKNHSERDTKPSPGVYETPAVEIFDLRMVVVGSGDDFQDATGNTSVSGDFPPGPG